MQLEPQPRYEMREARGSRIPPPSFADEARSGLQGTRKSLPCRFLYDDRGSLLFEQICEMKDYYPTRAETEILSRYSTEIMGNAFTNAVIELGSGSARKARLLLTATIEKHGNAHYLPIDISMKALELCGHSLVKEFEPLRVSAILGEYDPGLDTAIAHTEPGRTLLWLGGSIGNYAPVEAASWMRSFRARLDDGDHFVVSTLR